MSGKISTSPLEHATLKELYLLGDPLDPSVLQALAKSSLPSLQKLVLCLSHEMSKTHDDLAVESLRNLNAPGLRELYLYDAAAKPVDVAVELARTLPALRCLGVGGPFLEEHLEELSEAELAPLSALQVFELDLESFDLSTTVAKSLGNIREIDNERILPAEYESW